MKLIKKQDGFTLIEVLIVIGILAVLLAIVLIAVNPGRQFAESNNTQRRSDVNAILSAVHQYAAQNNGDLPAGLTSTAEYIGSDTEEDEVDLCSILVPDYIADLPADPQDGTREAEDDNCLDAEEYFTGYQIATSAGNRITVTAPGAELDETISVTR